MLKSRSGFVYPDPKPVGQFSCENACSFLIYLTVLPYTRNNIYKYPKPALFVSDLGYPKVKIPMLYRNLIEIITSMIYDDDDD